MKRFTFGKKISALLALSASSAILMGSAPIHGINGLKLDASAFKNWGLTNTEARSHIQALDAWRIEEGSRDIVVAVVDTGLDAHHRDLKQNVWHDPKAKSSVQTSADGGVFGWNFVTNAPNPYDDHGHGTHVAGIIGAVTDPDAGVSGVAHRVSIMSVKYYSDANSGVTNLRNTVKAIHYAVDHGARIINYSGGGPEFSEDEFMAIREAEARGVLFIAAAGNEHQNTDKPENHYYPAAYGLSNIISVAATNIHNDLLASSNWGVKDVDVAAPGENIYSTLPGGRYGYMTGTSQATAFVSGLAALILAKNPKLTPQQVKEIIMTSVDRLPQLEGRINTGGRINAYRALLAVNNVGGSRILAGPRRGLMSLLDPSQAGAADAVAQSAASRR